MGGYTGEFEMIGDLSIAEHIRKTHFRFRNSTDYEHYINAIDQNYDSEDAIFTGCFYEIDTLVLNTINRSQYRNRCDFKHEIVEYHGDNCFNPTKGYCFIKCINCLTGKE